MEEAVSVAIFKAARAEPALAVLSWQGVNGKGYFTADIKLRLPSGERMEPDLILLAADAIWLVEVKGRHSEAAADETKLHRLLTTLTEAEIHQQVARKTSHATAGLRIVPAVAYYDNDLRDSAECSKDVVHLDWRQLEAHVKEVGLAQVLRELSTRQ